MDTTSSETDEISYRCKTTLRTEEKRVEWIIEHFSAVVDQKLSNVQFTFNVGDSIGVPTTCNVVLSYDQYQSSNSSYNFILSLNDNFRSEDNIIALIDFSIQYGNVGNRKLECKNRRITFTDKNQHDILASGAIGCTLNRDLTNDTASLYLKLTVYARQVLTEVTVNQAENEAIWEQESNRQYTEDMQRLLESANNSDFVIKVPSDSEQCEFESFRVHKNILAARSEVFKVMFETPMKESQSGEVTLEDLSSRGLKTILKFIYTGMVDDDWKSNPREIVNAADRFSLSSLKKFVDMNLHLTCNVENALDLLQIACYHILTTAFKNISKYIQLNLHQIVKEL